jgi:hypothetical protein
VGILRSRLVRVGAAAIVGVLGFVTYEAVTQVAGAQPPPVINTGFAAYPPAGVLPAGCTADGLGFLLGFRTFIDPTGVPTARVNANASAFTDPGAGASAAARSMRRFQTLIQPNDRVIARWTAWAPNCGAEPVSFPLKATNEDHFDLTDDQALVREPNGTFSYPFCYSSGADSCPGPAGVGGFQLSTVVPQLNIVCGYQLDMIIGGPLQTVGPHGTYYATSNRQQAVAAHLGTFNTNGPNMLIDAANGAMPCAATQRIVINKLWAGTGIVPPSNVPAGWTLTVTSSTSQTNLAPLGTATCTITNGTFGCIYTDTGVAGNQPGLLVNNDSLLTVTETPFEGNTVDITFPVGMSSQFVTCAGNPVVCQLNVTNTPPPPPDTTTTTTVASTTTTIPVIATTIPNEPTPPPTLPPTLPPTGSSGTTPFLLLALVVVPLGAALVLITRRRSAAP